MRPEEKNGEGLGGVGEEDAVAAYGRRLIAEQEKRAAPSVARPVPPLAQTEPTVLVLSQGSFLNEMALRRVLGGGQGLKGTIIEKAPFRWIQAEGAKFVSARAVRAVLRTGVLGDHTRDRLLILEVNGPEDFARMTSSGLAISSKALIHSWQGRVIETRLEERFRYAVEELENRRRAGRMSQIKDVEPDEQANIVRHVAWASKGGDPRRGAAQNLRACLPLEVGFDTYRQALLWIRSLPRSEEQVETLAAEGE